MASDSSIACTIAGSTVTLRFPDGTESDVPMEVVNRSQVLQDSICATKADGKFLVGASPVHLQCWLECVRAFTAAGIMPATVDSETLAQYLEVRRASGLSDIADCTARAPKLDCNPVAGPILK